MKLVLAAGCRVPIELATLILIFNLETACLAQSDLTSQLAAGRALFEREWKSADTLARSGDGLGPMSNDVSCVGCHMQGGIGGGGPEENNVELLSLVSPSNVRAMLARTNGGRLFQVRIDSTSRASFLAEVVKKHVGFREGDSIRSNIVLHRFGHSDGYKNLRAELLGLGEKVPNDVAAGKPIPIDSSPIVEIRLNETLGFRLSRRNTTALFGAGLIDAISERTLKKLARVQQQHSDISGRIAPTANGPGRFGWRGQVARLSDFVLIACANELGLQVPGHDQAISPSYPNYVAPGLDLEKQQCDELIAFVASLPAPRKIVAEHADHRKLVAQGEKLFDSVGCAICHVPKVGNVERIYSDLLLHDMGTSLSDPVPAAPSRSVQRVSTSGYSGSSFDVFSETPAAVTRQEWKTPPLWGVRDSAPYMHDGRAGSLSEAILMHGGEGRKSMTKYLRLPIADQQALVAFLETFAAPSLSGPAATGGEVAQAP